MKKINKILLGGILERILICRRDSENKDFMKKILCKLFGHKYKEEWFEVVGRAFRKDICQRCRLAKNDGRYFKKKD